MSRLTWNVVLLLVVIAASYTVWRMGNPTAVPSTASSTKVTTTAATAKTTASNAVARSVTTASKSTTP
jgi:hypothetical protein